LGSSLDFVDRIAGGLVVDAARMAHNLREHGQASIDARGEGALKTALAELLAAIGR
jgi:stage V sporulation protein SpoVS